MALDYCHHSIVRALEKDIWDVADIPLFIRTPERSISIDIEAWRTKNGETQRVMLGEVKCFPDRKRTTTETYIALGQYILYRAVLLEAGILTPLYLAVPQEVYDTIFDSTVRRAIRDNRIKLLIVNIDTETIVEWIE